MLTLHILRPMNVNNGGDKSILTKVSHLLGQSRLELSPKSGSCSNPENYPVMKDSKLYLNFLHHRFTCYIRAKCI